MKYKGRVVLAGLMILLSAICIGLMVYFFIADPALVSGKVL